MGTRVLPHLIITRPAPDGDRFAGQLRAALGADVPITLAPIMAIAPLDASSDAHGFIFTSSNGVAAAVRMNVARGAAWCVGDRTADMANAAGFDAQSAGGNAEDLIELVKCTAPAIPIAHIRGEHARGDIGPRLRAAGLNCIDVVAYTQTGLMLQPDVIARIEGGNLAIIPLFSPRATKLLMEQVKMGPNVRLIAISEQTAGSHNMIVAAQPNGLAMLAAVIAAFRAFS